MFPVTAAVHQESPFSFYPVEDSQHFAFVVLSDNAVYCRQLLRARRTAVAIAPCQLSVLTLIPKYLSELL